LLGGFGFQASSSAFASHLTPFPLHPSPYALSKARGRRALGNREGFGSRIYNSENADTASLHPFGDSLMRKIVAMVILVISVIGLAHAIEINARPETGRQGQHVEGGHEH
jgi:hypothetical protein